MFQLKISKERKCVSVCLGLTDGSAGMVLLWLPPVYLLTVGDVTSKGTSPCVTASAHSSWEACLAKEKAWPLGLSDLAWVSPCHTLVVQLGLSHTVRIQVPSWVVCELTRAGGNAPRGSSSVAQFM